MPARKYSPKEKLLILDEVKRDGQKVSAVCKKWQISRFTFYRWAKNYRDPSNLRRANLLREKRPNGKNHPKAIAGKREKLILECVLRNPSWSSHRIEKFLGEYLNGAFRVSNHGIQNVLNRYSLNTEQARFEYSRSHLTRSVFANNFSDFEKYKIIEEYLIAGRKIAQICRQFHISRFTFYAWLKKYEVEKTISSLSDARLRGESHPKFAGEAVKQKVLDVVAANPTYSVHKIHAHLAGVVGHHAIQNILSREDLNTFAKRQLFAQGYIQEPQVQVAPLYEAPVPRLSLWRLLFAPFTTVPKWVIRHPATWPIVFPTLAFLAYIFEVDKLARPQMLFPIIALSFGFIFFLYSLKYYISLIIVMRVAQGESGGSTGGTKSTKGTKGALSVILSPSLRSRVNSAKNLIARSFGLSTHSTSSGQASSRPQDDGVSRVNPLLMNLDKIQLEGEPFVSIHVAVYNEKRVIERLIEACRTQKWSNFEVILADDSTDETTGIAKNALSGGGRRLENTFKNEVCEIFVSKVAKGQTGPIFKLIHRFNREGFKGAALQKALENTNPYADFIVVFDSDFVPYPDTIEQFVKSFQATAGGLDNVKNTKIAAIQGYQWHVLNKSENWVTRGVRTEYAGSYVIERAGIGIYGGLNMIAGSVFCLRADVLRQFGWGRSITEDLELTLRLYEAGYKVLFTPYIQAPAEAVSTIKRLIRQRMRWAEGHTFNIRKMWTRIFNSPNLTGREKFEFLYLSPYYLQAAFFIFGSLAWFIAEVVLKVHLPFWTAAWGWSLVFVNFLSLPLMNLIGLFLEESDERDYMGIASFIVLSYILVPFQAYAAVKALFENEEGPWFRTPKTGNITDVFGRVRFYQWFAKLKLGLPKLPVGQAKGAVSSLALALAGEGGEPSAFNSLSGYSFRPRRIRLVSRSVLAILMVSVMILNYFAFFVPQAEARHSANHLEQQVNIIDQTYTTTSTTYVPTNDSLGLVNWDADVYDGTVSVYFEALLSGLGGDAGSYSSIFCVSADDCKISYYDVTNADLKFRDCNSADCTTGTNASPDSGGDVGKFTSVYCPGTASVATTDCKIAYYDVTNGDLKFRDCDNSDCSSGTTTLLDGNTGCVLAGCDTTSGVKVGSLSNSLYCVATTDCKIAYFDETNTNLKFVDCNNSACSSGDANTVDSTGVVGVTPSVFCPGNVTTDCKIAHYDSGNADLRFRDCASEDCTSGSNNAVDSTDSVGSYSSMQCDSAGTDCKIAHYSGTARSLRFTDCNSYDCTSNTSNDITSLTDPLDISNYCVALTDCKISFSNGSLGFRDCNSADCTSGTSATVDSSSQFVPGTSVYCPGTASVATTDCKISYYDSINGELEFRDCGSSDCSSGSSNAVDGINRTATAGLFAGGGGAQATCSGGGNVEVAADSTVASLVRTACTVSLTDGNNYTVRVKSSDTSANANLKAARLIIIQDPVAADIKKTSTVVEVGNVMSTFGTAYADITNPKYYCYDSDDNNGTACTDTAGTNWTPTPTVSFEATLLNNTAGQKTFAQLYDVTAAAAVTESRVSCGSGTTPACGTTTYGRVRSGTISTANFPAGHVYKVQIQVDGGNGLMANAHIILDQSDATNITNLETVQMYNNTKDASTFTGYQDRRWDNTFKRTNVEQPGQTVQYFFESVMFCVPDAKLGGCQSSETVYIQLYNSTDGSAITNSEISLQADNTTAVRKRTADLRTNLPDSAFAGTSKNLTIQMKTTASNSVNTTNDSWLIIQIAGLQIPEKALLALPLAFFFPKAAKKIRVWLKKRRKGKKGQGKPDRPRGASE